MKTAIHPMYSVVASLIAIVVGPIWGFSTFASAGLGWQLAWSLVAIIVLAVVSIFVGAGFVTLRKRMRARTFAPQR